MIDDNVRQMIREVLAEELQRVKAGAGAGPAPQEEIVSLGSDAELAAFVSRLIRLAGDPKARRDIEEGRLIFRLAQAQQQASAPQPVAAELTSAGGTVTMDRGVVSERQVDAFPKGTRILLAGKGVKLTPLARDRLRQRGIKIERTG